MDAGVDPGAEPGVMRLLELGRHLLGRRLYAVFRIRIQLNPDTAINLNPDPNYFLTPSGNNICRFI